MWRAYVAANLWATNESIAPNIGCVPQTLHEWVRRHKIDNGVRDGVTTKERERIRALERDQRIGPGQRDPEVCQRVFRPGGARPPIQVVREFIDQHRDAYGVEPICKVLQIAPSGTRDMSPGNTIRNCAVSA